MRLHRTLGAVAVALAIALIASAVTLADTERDPGSDALQRTWERTDRAVAEGVVSRTWMWGPQDGATQRTEEYAESPGGQRTVVYYDKSRMEIGNPAGDPTSPWYVTNGLLVVELMTGNLQVGDSLFEQREAADITIAGDPNNDGSPTYASLNGLRSAAPIADGAAITTRITRSGSTSADPSLAARGATAAQRVTVPGIDHQVASPFWTFMNSSGTVWDNAWVTDLLFESPFYATGLPITEAYWATVQVNGGDLDVLLQCFERRCLTWTPDNPEGWQVEAGNVGQHYATWRYDGNQPATSTPVTSPTATVMPTSTPDPNAVYQSSMRDWPLITGQTGSSAYPTNNDYRVTSYRGTSLWSVSGPDFTSGVAQIRMQRISAAGDIDGCLTLRAEKHPSIRTAPKSSINICLTYRGGQATGVHAFSQAIVGTDPPQITGIGSWALNGNVPANAWTTLRVELRGTTLSVSVNGIAVGSAGVTLPTGTRVGVAANGHPSDTSITVAFSDLVLYP